MLNNDDKKLIKDFKSMVIPNIYKDDKTDCLLFVEHVDFDVCEDLLKGKKRFTKDNETEKNEFDRFLSQIDESKFDSYALLHFERIKKIMNLFFEKMS